MNREPVSWKRILLGLFLGLSIIGIALGIFYWVEIWSPLKESRDAEAVLDAYEEFLRREGKLP